MDRARLAELHFIAPIENVASILELGILSHTRAGAHEHIDISDGVVQAQRAQRTIHDPRLSEPQPLHDYANLYICGRNPMLYVRRHLHETLVVLRVDVAILDQPGVMVTDGNAASAYTREYLPDLGVAAIDEPITFLGDPTHPNRYEFYDRKRRMMAEVLVPDVVDSAYIVGARASCDGGRVACEATGFPHPIEIDKRYFYL